VRFCEHNLLADPPFSRMDLVSCRNVLIYMGTQLQNHLICVFHYALKPHGFLLLGNAETVGTMTNLFELQDRAHKIYSKVATASRPQIAFSMGRHLEGLEAGVPAQSMAKHGPSWNVAEEQKEFDRWLLQEFAPAAVLVDGALEVVHSRGNIDRSGNRKSNSDSVRQKSRLPNISHHINAVRETNAIRNNKGISRVKNEIRSALGAASHHCDPLQATVPVVPSTAASVLSQQ
jgi:hypothetical protein